MTSETFVRLNYVPREWQRRCRRERRRFNVIVAHRRSGKSLFAMVELVDGALQSTKPLPLYAYVAPFLRQARSIAWAELKALVAPLRAVGAVEVMEGETSIRFLHNGAVLRLLGADNPDALRGLRLDGVVLDEVAQMSSDVWHSVVQPALADRKGWAIFIGTPSGIDAFSDLYNNAKDKPDWFRVVVPATETGAIDAEELERLRDEMPPQAFAREMLCDFGASGSDQLLSVQDVEAAAARRLVPRDVEHAPRIIGVDPARFGDDRSVIMRRQGLAAFPPIVARGVDNMRLADRVASEIAAWDADAVFVDAGAGAGVIDRLRQLGHAVIEVPFGGTPLRPNEFANRRAEMWVLMAEWIRGGGGIPNDRDLIRELATPTFRFDPKGRKILEAKDEVKKRLSGASCDLGDALCLTFAAPVAARSRYPEGLRRERHAYHPFSDERMRERLDQRAARRGR